MKSLAKYLNALLLTIPLLLIADEGEHLPVGTRKPSTETSETSNTEDTAAQGYTLQEEGRCGYVYDRFAPTYYPNEYHWLVQAIDDRVELEDGSVWKVNAYDIYKAQNWRLNDSLTITQNKRWFSSYAYKITNKNTGSSIESNLFLGPIKNGEYTKYIYTLDASRGQIVLTDNTHWEISSGDAYIFQDWALDDAIIIGTNSGWDSKCEAILINVTMNNYVRAKQF